MAQQFRPARPVRRPHVVGMGHFYVNVEVASIARRDERRTLRALVDTGSEYTWVPEDILNALGVDRELTIEFVTADGRRVVRDAGYAYLAVGQWPTVDTVV